ncbi:MAG TPA: hypothetical protein VFI91_10505 [Longimicrobiaceae bacterium]|nr:hypothetical protein [Longimicrobiaceae bacterium]
MTTFLIIFAFIFVLGPIASAYAKRLSSEVPPETLKRLAEVSRLREEVDQLTANVNRMEEEQSFLLRLLSEGERPRLPDAKDPE